MRNQYQELHAAGDEVDEENIAHTEGRIIHGINERVAFACLHLGHRVGEIEEAEHHGNDDARHVRRNEAPRAILFAQARQRQRGHRIEAQGDGQHQHQFALLRIADAAGDGMGKERADQNEEERKTSDTEERCRVRSLWIKLVPVREAEERRFHPEGEHDGDEGRPCIERRDHTELLRREHAFARVQRCEQEVEEARNYTAQPVNGCLTGEFAECAHNRATLAQATPSNSCLWQSTANQVQVSGSVAPFASLGLAAKMKWK